MIAPVRQPEVEKARITLARLVGLTGLTRLEIQRRLHEQGYRIDATRVLRGELDLKLWQLVAILGVLEMAPAEFFKLTFRDPKEQPVPAAARSHDGPLRPAAVTKPRPESRLKIATFTVRASRAQAVRWARVARFLGCRSVSTWLEEMADEQVRRVEELIPSQRNS